MSPMKEAKLYAGEALANIAEAAKHLGIAGVGFLAPIAKGAISKTEKALDKALESGKPAVVNAVYKAGIAIRKAGNSLVTAAEQAKTQETTVFCANCHNVLRGPIPHNCVECNCAAPTE